MKLYNLLDCMKYVLEKMKRNLFQNKPRNVTILGFLFMTQFDSAPGCPQFIIHNNRAVDSVLSRFPISNEILIFGNLKWH